MRALRLPYPQSRKSTHGRRAQGQSSDCSKGVVSTTTTLAKAIDDNLAQLLTVMHKANIAFLQVRYEGCGGKRNCMVIGSDGDAIHSLKADLFVLATNRPIKNQMPPSPLKSTMTLATGATYLLEQTLSLMGFPHWEQGTGSIGVMTIREDAQCLLTHHDYKHNQTKIHRLLPRT